MSACRCAEHHLDVRLQQLVSDATGVPASWTFSYDRFVDEMNAPDLSASVLPTGPASPT